MRSSATWPLAGDAAGRTSAEIRPATASARTMRARRDLRIDASSWRPDSSDRASCPPGRRTVAYGAGRCKERPAACASDEPARRRIAFEQDRAVDPERPQLGVGAGRPVQREFDEDAAEHRGELERVTRPEPD